jgi:hypothetical protein
MSKKAVSITKPKRDRVLEFAKAVPKAGPVPTGSTRLTVNMENDLHMKLKLAAVKQSTTMGKLLEELVDKYVSE